MAVSAPRGSYRGGRQRRLVRVPGRARPRGLHLQLVVQGSPVAHHRAHGGREEVALPASDHVFTDVVQAATAAPDRRRGARGGVLQPEPAGQRGPSTAAGQQVPVVPRVVDAAGLSPLSAAGEHGVRVPVSGGGGCVLEQRGRDGCHEQAVHDARELWRGGNFDERASDDDVFRFTFHDDARLLTDHAIGNQSIGNNGQCSITIHEPSVFRVRVDRR